MDSEMKRMIMLDNYENPFNKGLIDDDSYDKFNTNNSSCIDNIDIMIKMNKDTIEDAHFDGEACVICTSSTSILMKMIIGKSKNEVLTIIDNFKKMINEEEYDEEILKEANVYNEIYKQPSRKNCALQTWLGLEKYLKNKEQ